MDNTHPVLDGYYESKNVDTLLNMGFGDEERVRKALRYSRNDINEAVSYLTNSTPMDFFEEKTCNVDLGGIDTVGQCSSVVPAAPPPYESLPNVQKAHSPCPTNNLEFPTAYLYELESRVYPDNWSIPYKREESLGKCLISATMLANQGLCEASDDCCRFMDQCLPEAFKKLLTSGAVRSWTPDIQEGVFNMLQLLVDLAVARLKYGPVHETLMGKVLAMAFDPQAEFHIKNKHRKCPEPGIATTTNSLDPFGWLLSLINRFAEEDGFSNVQKHFDSGTLSGSAMSSLLLPLSKCVEFLNVEWVAPLLLPCVQKAKSYISSLTENDLKKKDMFCVSELLGVLKCLCVPLWPEQEGEINGLRLEVILRMLKCPHFNARMNGLKEVVRLIEDSSSTGPKNFGGIHPDKLQDWLAENKVLSIALEGNIDQAQYADKIKGIIEFAGPRLSVDELSKIWSMQVDQNCQVVDNIHAVMAAASAKFNPTQFDHLLSLLQQSWDAGNEQIWRRLLVFAGCIGKDTNQNKHSSKVLELLWDFAHSGQLPPALVEQALDEHLGILGQVLHREQTKKAYLLKCLDNIKKGTCVLSSLKFLHNLNQLIFKSAYYKHDKAAIHDLNKNHDLIKVVSTSLVRCHKQAVTSANGEPLAPTTLVDGRYSHEEFVEAHLNLLRFVLQEGSQYLPWSRTKEIWDTLVTNPDACNKDRELCVDWFSECIRDLERDTQAQLFQNKLLKLDPLQVSQKGFDCFKLYFESVNIAESKMRKTAQNWTVDKVDLTGLDFLWLLVLSSSNEIADRAMEILLEVSYHSLATRLKNDPVSLHRKFIGECYKRLEAVVQSVGVTAVCAAVSNATKTLTAISVAEVAALSPPTRTARLQSVHRLLHLAECYISSIEDLHTAARAILPHGASFLGHPVLLHLLHDANHEEFLLMAYGNETLHSARQRIAQVLQVSLDNVQFYVGDTLVSSKDQKLLRHFNMSEDQGLFFKLSPGANPVSPFTQVKIKPLLEEDATSPEPSTACNMSLGAAPLPSGSSGHQFYMDLEKSLPGVVMSSGGQVFEMLYELANLEDSRITNQVRNLLQLIPTDPNVLDTLDALTAKTPVDVPSVVEARPGSPVKRSASSSSFASVLASKEPKQSQGGGESSYDVLKRLLDSSSAGMTPFRLLYNLEVVSSKLIPTRTGLSGQGGSKSSHLAFCQAFVEAGGLTLVTSILMNESAMSSDTEQSLRHGCYYLAVQIARYLLCGQPVCSLSTCWQIGRGLTTSTADENSSDIKSTVVEVDLLPGLARKAAIRLMPSGEILNLIQCLMRVCWASAAGQLHLAVCPLPLRESTAIHGQQQLGLATVGRRSRQSSTGSTTSNGSEGESTHSLHSGLCGQQENVSRTDAQLAAETFSFLVTCLEIRSDHIDAFSAIPSVQDFFVDVLLGSPSEKVRESALSQLIRLSCIQIPQNDDTTQEHVVTLYFLLKALLKVPLPLWVPSSSTRGQNQRLLGQCKQYFKLVCHLLHGLTISEQKAVQIRPQEMIEEETNWLQGFTPSTNPTLQDADNALLVGHLGLIQTLLTCEGVDKALVGKTLVLHLLNRFLFPASHLISEGIGHNTNQAVQHLASRGASQEAQLAAYAVLVELATGCLQNLEMIVKRLIHMHHRPNPLLAKEYEYEPLVAGRSACGYIGLKNAGATCYMNSVLQQIYMTPGIKEAVLSVDQNDLDEDSLFSQLQLIFGHLLESHLQYHVPEKFWKCFRLWGVPINVREQQDAFEFFTHLVDQVDEFLKSRGGKPIFGPRYEGLFSDQKICQGCPHRYEREESFMALNLPVKSRTLIDTLDQFVKGELLEGDNAYFCEKCGEKRNTVKRTCIKSLPPVLVIQLKRFGYDWEANRSMKFDDHFVFPWVLDMGPYTASGIMEKENAAGQEKSPASGNKVLYELVGIVVHSGQATAGHYYSFIKERRHDIPFATNIGKWFKFNDTTVEEFDLNESSLESECFGGTYKAKVTNTESSYPEMRQRYWNAYMLLYEALEEPRTPRTPRKTPTKLNFSRSDSGGRMNKKNCPQPQASPGLPRPSRDSLSQLTQLVDRGERQGLFVDSVPAHVQRLVQEENLHFINNRDVFNSRYFGFVQEIVTTNNSKNCSGPGASHFMVLNLKLSVNFLFNTYLRYKRKNGPKLLEWVGCLESIISSSKEATEWLINYLSSDTGRGLLKPFLLEFPIREGRQMFSTVLEKAINCFFYHGGKPSSPDLDLIVDHLVGMLDKDATDYCKHCTQFFCLLSVYADTSLDACLHLLQKDIFKKCLVFLLGPGSSDMNSSDTFPRHWSSVQSRDFNHLHTLMARLVLCCNLEPHQSNSGISLDSSVENENVTKKAAMPKEIQDALYGPGSFRYIQEVVSACREGAGGSSLRLLTEMLVKCSFCNEHFSSILIKQVMLQYSTVPSNELKNLSYLLLELLVLEDDVQRTRLSYAIEGFTDDTGTPLQGIFTIVKQNQMNDSRRSYQAVKFLVTLAHKCCLAKEYLVQYSSVLQWSVNWLKKMMTGHGFYMSCGPVSNEDSNTKTFQRTVSAQDTLAEATALLTELESPENATEEAMDLEESPVAPSGESEYWDEQVFPEVKASPEKEEPQSSGDQKEVKSDRILKRTRGREHLDSIDGVTPPTDPTTSHSVHFADTPEETVEFAKI